MGVIYDRRQVGLLPCSRLVHPPNLGFAQRSIDYDHVLDADLSEWPGNGYPAMLASRSTTGTIWGYKLDGNLFPGYRPD